MAFTVRAMDAGPIIATETIQVDDQIKVSTFSVVSVLPYKKAWEGVQFCFIYEKIN